MKTNKPYKIVCYSGGFWANTVEVVFDLTENLITINKVTKPVTVNIVTNPLDNYKYVNKILKIVNTWEGDYDQPGLMDGPEVVITVFGEEEKKHYIHSVSNKYYPKNYKKVVKYINKLIEFSGLKFEEV